MTACPIEHLYESAAELRRLLPALAAEIPERGSVADASPGGSPGKRTAAPIPWNEQAAMLFLEIHGDARRYESLLTLRLRGRAVYRGGSDELTIECLGRLPVLVAHGRDVGLDPLDLVDVERALLSWPRQARLLLGVAHPGDEPPTRVPGDARCPDCDRPLVLSPGWRSLEQDSVQALCTSCRDEDDHPLAWPVDRWVGHLRHDELVTAETARARYGLSASQVRVWKNRGRIHPHGQDSSGRQTFRLSDVLALLEARPGAQER